mgnify:FL=1
MVKIHIIDKSGEIFMVVEKTSDSWKVSRQIGSAGKFTRREAKSIVNTLRTAYPGLDASQFLIF